MANRVVIIVHEETRTRTVWYTVPEGELFAVSDTTTGERLVPAPFVDRWNDGIWVRERPQPQPEEPPMLLIHPVALNMAQATPRPQRKKNRTATTVLILAFGVLLGHFLSVL